MLGHQSGATITGSLTQFAPPAATVFEAAVWGEAGLLPMPPRPEGSLSGPYATAANELVAAAVSGEPHTVDVVFGTHVGELLANAQAQLDAGYAGEATWRNGGCRLRQQPHTQAATCAMDRS